MEVKSSIFGDRDAGVDHDPVSGVHTNLLLDVDPRATISGAVDHTAFFQGERKKRLDRNKITEQGWTGFNSLYCV